VLKVLGRIRNRQPTALSKAFDAGLALRNHFQQHQPMLVPHGFGDSGELCIESALRIFC
jgi:hypothetical protein